MVAKLFIFCSMLGVIFHASHPYKDIDRAEASNMLTLSDVGICFPVQIFIRLIHAPQARPFLLMKSYSVDFIIEPRYLKSSTFFSFKIIKRLNQNLQKHRWNVIDIEKGKWLENGEMSSFINRYDDKEHKIDYSLTLHFNRFIFFKRIYSKWKSFQRTRKFRKIEA